MGTSSFRLACVGGGYWRVLYRLWLKCVFGIGTYKALSLGNGIRKTSRSQDTVAAIEPEAKL